MIAKKVFVNNWFNETHKSNITQPDLIQLLEVATKNQWESRDWVWSPEADVYEPQVPWKPN